MTEKLKVSLTFEELTPNLTTKRWAVMSLGKLHQSGVVSWHRALEKYCFWPLETFLDHESLREIAEFCEQETKNKEKEAAK